MPPRNKRKIVAVIPVSVDGSTEGSFGETEWIESWADAGGLIGDVDAFVGGGRMCLTHGMHRQGICEAPTTHAPFVERALMVEEVRYAKKTHISPHLVMSRTLDKVEWPPAVAMTRIDRFHEIKEQDEGNIDVAGGATLIAAMLDAGLVDELRLIAHPIVLGRGSGMCDPACHVGSQSSNTQV